MWDFYAWVNKKKLQISCHASGSEGSQQNQSLCNQEESTFHFPNLNSTQLNWSPPLLTRDSQPKILSSHKNQKSVKVKENNIIRTRFPSSK